MKKEIKKLDGRIFRVPDKKCDHCNLNETDCKKIDVPGIGRCCLVEKKHIKPEHHESDRKRN